MRSMSVCLFAWVLVCVVTVGKAAEADKAAGKVEITDDVVYGHKDGLAMTFDVLKPRQNANRAGVLFLVSGGWYSRWSPPQGQVQQFQPLLDKGFTMFIVRHGSSPKYVATMASMSPRRTAGAMRATWSASMARTRGRVSGPLSRER